MRLRQCMHAYSTHVGYFTNNPENDRSRPQSMRSCCGRQECLENARKWVVMSTNEPAYLYPFSGQTLPAELLPYADPMKRQPALTSYNPDGVA